LKTTSYNKEDYNWWIDPAVNSAKQIVPFILKCFPIKSVLDFGCAQGGWLSVFQEHGVKKIMGLDGEWVDTKDLLIPATSFHSVNLTTYQHNPIDKYDLCICLEVAEHLDCCISDSLISNLTLASDIILFSAAVPEQGGQHHVNERPPSYWNEKFEVKGFTQLDFLRPRFWENEEVAWWYRQNMMVYSKTNLNDELHYFSDNFFGKHIVHPTAFAEKCSELSIENASFRNLIKQLLKRFF
jgi:hypothetical protein